jgi:hypothetical protein
LVARRRQSKKIPGRDATTIGIGSFTVMEGERSRRSLISTSSTLALACGSSKPVHFPGPLKCATAAAAAAAAAAEIGSREEAERILLRSPSYSYEHGVELAEHAWKFICLYAFSAPTTYLRRTQVDKSVSDAWVGESSMRNSDFGTKSKVALRGSMGENKERRYTCGSLSLSSLITARFTRRFKYYCTSRSWGVSVLPPTQHSQSFRQGLVVF